MKRPIETLPQPRSTVRARRALSLAVAAVIVASCSPESSPESRPEPKAEPGQRSTPDVGSSRPTRPTVSPVVGSGLLTAASGGDGDSWRDTNGREYRLGLVNTPEYNACYGPQATAARKRLVSGGFRAQVYTSDRYGRLVAVVSTADGTNLNVWLARQGYADDRYFAQYRHENPALSTELDTAFGAAKRERAGLWGAC